MYFLNGLYYATHIMKMKAECCQQVPKFADTLQVIKINLQAHILILRLRTARYTQFACDLKLKIYVHTMREIKKIHRPILNC